MCGFAGVIAWDEKYRVSRDTLAKMSAAVAHRGPDGEGTYFSPDAEITPDRPQVALAHRRLAIIDPDPRGNQPFTDNEGRWLVFNGEIYNYRELRAELKSLKPEYEWRTDCDTEVLLVAYGVWGEKCVDHFNGMFAFAIWDGVKRELFLARDRMGQKPLYVAYVSRDDASARGLDYHDAPGRPALVAFASELAALRRVPWFNASLDGSHLALYLSLGYVSDGSIYVGARELGPAATLRLRSAETGYHHQRYYFHPVASVEHSDSPDVDVIASTRSLVRRAVQRQLVADVPLGCFLSGGVDSSVVAASMCADGNEVRTFSIGFDDSRYDEREPARRVAAHLGTRHEEFLVSPRAADDLPKLAAVFGQPFADSSALPTHYLSRETRGQVKVALSGDGGDELFGGYDRYRAIRIAERVRSLPSPVRALVASKTWGKLPGTHPKSVVTRFKRFASSVDLPPDQRYPSYLRLFDAVTLDQLLRREIRNGQQGDGDTLDGRYGLLLHRMDVVRSMALDRTTYLPGDLLTKVDRASMLHALEVRSPFMDHELVQFAAGLTTDQLLRGGPKRMLREAFAEDLPAWVFKRKKMGFAVPIGDWFRAELRPMLHDHLFAADSFGSTHFNMNVVRRLVDEHERFKVDHSQRLYALLMLELWWKQQRG